MARSIRMTVALMLGSALPSLAQAKDVVVTAQLPGPVVDADRLPVATQALNAGTIARDGAPDLLRATLSDLPGVSFAEAQDNPYQPDLFYRGYEASPLGGDAQGLAVYVDGARFNQPFGDTVNWDAIPDIAVKRLTLESANPAFGLNALGGAIAVNMKSGRDMTGVSGWLSAGRFGKRGASAEVGARAGRWSFYLAGQVEHDDDWRDFSPSSVHQLYGDIGLDGDWGTLDLKLIGAETNLTGNGASPVELLAARRQAVFTWPDNSRNLYGRAQLSAALVLGGGLTLRPQAYVAGYRQRTANGDLSDAEPCAGNGRLLCLEGEDDAPLTGGTGVQFPSFAGGDTYAQLNLTRTRTTSVGASVQLDGRAGSHSFAVGASWDGSNSRFDAQSLIGVLTDDRGFGDPQGAIDMQDGSIRPVDVKSRRDDIGIYAGDVIALTPRFDLSLSARYNDSRVRLSDRLGTALDGRHRFARLNPAIGVVWRTSDGVALYAGYAESNRAPTPAELSCADPEAPCSLAAFFVGDPPLKQVVARTWEAGLRGRSKVGGMTLSWRLGGWRATNSDDIIFAASATRGRAYFRNVGRTRRQGIEASASAESGAWTMSASYTLTDATYRTGFVVASPDNPAADEDGTITVRPGDRLPGIPRHLGKLVVMRRFGEVAQLSATGQCASGRWLLGDEANLTRPTVGYCIANLSGLVKVVKGVAVFAEVRNLFDRHYATFGTFSEVSEVNLAEAPGASDPRSLSPAAPRTWWIGARLRF